MDDTLYFWGDCEFFSETMITSSDVSLPGYPDIDTKEECMEICRGVATCIQFWFDYPDCYPYAVRHSAVNISGATSSWTGKFFKTKW